MGLFKGRPLCFFCGVFLAASLSIIGFDLNQKLIMTAGIAILMLTLMAACIFVKRIRSVTFSILLCFLAVLLALLSAAFRMDHKLHKANEMVGDRDISASIVAVEYVSENYSAYIVNIESMSDQKTNIKGLLTCRFKCELSVGDRVEAYATVAKISDTFMGRNGTDITKENDVLLMVVINQPEDGKVERFKREMPLHQKLFVQNGLTVIFDDLKNAVKERTCALVGNDDGALLNGFILGDTSDVPTNVIRDFRRSGVSHLFAVSGLHISVLLGAVELLLRRFMIHKYARCAVISVLSLVLLVFTGFSMSAMRAVFMLWIVYVAFIFSEEADAPTTLCLAVTLIILIYPYAVFELGLWMSFLATLGLVTVYPLVDSAIPTAKKKRSVGGFAWRTARSVIMTALMTVIASMFLLPVQWRIFGEISIVSIFTNVLLSPIVFCVLPLSVIGLVCLGIPFLGAFIGWSVKTLCGIILKIVEWLSSLELATVSLGYDFAAPLVLLFTVSMIFVLVIKLRKKWLIGVPIVAFAVSFTAGIFIFNSFASRSITYYGENTKEIISVTDSGSLCVIDMSNGAYGRLYSVMDDAEKYGATCVDKLIFTKVSKGHISSMEYLFRNSIVKDIYLPLAKDEKQLENMRALVSLAENCGVNAWIYERDDVFEIGSTSLAVINTEADEGWSWSVFVKGKESLFGYTDAFLENSLIREMLGDCDTVFVGNKGVPTYTYSFDVSEDATVIYSSRDIWSHSRARSDIYNTYVNKYDTVRVKFKFK